MSNPLFDISQYQSGATQSYSTDWIDATGTDSYWDEPELHPDLENSTADPTGDAEYNSTKVPIMPEEKTSEPLHAEVEVVEELSPSEEDERHRLELRVERAFYQAGSALRELRDKRLFRNTHKSFEEYCQERFGFNRTSAHHKIRAAEIFENLFTFSKQSGNTEVSEDMFTFSNQVLPTKETQIRPLAKLEPEEQCQVWQQAVNMADGKVPTERTVKEAVLRHVGIVDHLKQKNPSPSEFRAGDVIEIKVGKRSPLHPFNGMWGMIEHVGSFSYTVRISIARNTQQCKGEEMTKIDYEYTNDIKAVAKRIKRLVERDLEPVDFWVLEGLQRSICFTPRQLLYLERMEQDYGLATDDN